jgi:hypothetical protein
MSIELLLGKRGDDLSNWFLLTVGQKGEGGAGVFISGIDLCGLQGTLIELD